MEPKVENIVLANNPQINSSTPKESSKSKIKILVSPRDLIILLPIFFFLEIASEFYFNFFTSGKNILLPFIFLVEIALLAFYLILLVNNKQKLFIAMLVNLVLIIFAKFILMCIHPLYWDYRGYGNQSIEMGWFFLAPILFIFYSIIVWSFSFIVGSIFSKSFKKLEISENPPVLDFRAVNLLIMIVTGLLLVFTYLNNWENKYIAEYNAYYDALDKQQFIEKNNTNSNDTRNALKSHITPSNLKPSSLHAQ